MSYTKQTWQAGDEITSAKLNHLEDGINNVATEVANFPVEVNNPQDGDILIYNAAEQKWVSGSSNGGSGGSNLVVHDNNDTLDKTWKEIYNALNEGKYVCIVNFSNDTCKQMQIISAYQISDPGVEYIVSTPDFVDVDYKTNSENGYPVQVYPSGR